MKGTVLDGMAVRMAASDTVATAIEDIEDGDSLSLPSNGSIEIGEAIPFGHKVALERLERGDPVRKYGEVIGRATASIAPGEWVHTHNVESDRGRGDRAEAADA